MGFCSNCGSEIKEGTVFCSKCGARISDAGQQGAQGTPGATPNTYGSYPQDNKKPNNNKMVGMIAVGVVALVGLFILFKLVGLITTPGYEKPVKYLFDGMQDGDYKKMMKAFPDFMNDQFEDQIDDYYDGETDEFMEMMIASLEDQYGKRIKLSFKVTDKDKLDKDELDALEENIEWTYDEKVKVKEGYQLELEMKIKGSEDSDEDETEMTVYKIGSKWYLTEDSFGF